MRIKEAKDLTSKTAMSIPQDLSSNSKAILTRLNFKLIDSFDKGMWKYYLWENSKMQFGLTYDRGYYDCDITPLKDTTYNMSLVKLLKFLKNDRIFYNKELKEANLWNTLSTNGYVNLFSENYNLIEEFLKNYDSKEYDNYNKFEFDYDSI